MKAISFLTRTTQVTGAGDIVPMLQKLWQKGEIDK